MLDHLFPNGMWHYIQGGLLLAMGVSLLFVMTGLIGGMSTVFSSTWSYVSKAPFFQQERLTSSRAWRLVYALGLVLGGAAYLMIVRHGEPLQTKVSGWQLALGGFIGGFGARMSNGCTSGHGICGMASLKLPSLLSVITFLATAIATANLVRMLGGV